MDMTHPPQSRKSRRSQPLRDLVSRLLHRKLEAAGIPHAYEEFHDNHSSVDYRMDISLPLLAKALA